jgi:hypothetical protein
MRVRGELKRSRGRPHRKSTEDRAVLNRIASRASPTSCGAGTAVFLGAIPEDRFGLREPMGRPVAAVLKSAKE